MDSFLSSQRWAILEILAKRPSSPIEISKELGTSVAYVSQQLKLLDAAKLVEKEKTGLVERGKPRNVFSLAKELLHLTALTRGFPAKKTLYLNEHHKIILRIWLLEDNALHEVLERFYWAIKTELSDIEAIFLDSSKKSRLVVVSDSKKTKKFVDVGVEVLLVDRKDFEKISKEELHVIYDPKNLLLEKNLKGGERE